MSMEEAKKAFHKACETGGEADMEVFQEALDRALNEAADERRQRAIVAFNLVIACGSGLVGQAIDVEGETFVLEVRRVS